jgi:hypothetical protein
MSTDHSRPNQPLRNAPQSWVGRLRQNDVGRLQSTQASEWAAKFGLKFAHQL